LTPIIGKTLFLYYVLVERILDRRPTMFQIESKCIFLFVTPGHLETHWDLFDPESQPGTWALVDSNAEAVTPRGELISD